MKLDLLKEDLVSGINTVQNIISVKNTLPILSYILLEAQENELRLTTTDLDIGISCLIPVNTSEVGAISIPAKRFGDVIKELSEQDILITAKKNNLVFIETKTCQIKLMGLPREEFPKLPEFKDKEVIRLDQVGLKKMLSLVSFAVSMDETRYVLNGVLFKINNDNLMLVATDGRRLALVEKKINQSTKKEINMIIPIKTVHELMRALKDEGEISIVIGQNQAMFMLDKTVIISRLIEGEFPDYKQVIPPVSEHKLKIDRQQFLLGVRRAALLSTPDYQAVKLEVFPARVSSAATGKLVISKSTPDVGESREELPIEYNGKELVIGFNPGYLIDVLKNLADEKIVLELTEADKPGVLRTGGYIYIILPMRLA